MKREDKKEVYDWLGSHCRVYCYEDQDFSYLMGVLEWLFDHNDFSPDDMTLEEYHRFNVYIRALTVGV